MASPKADAEQHIKRNPHPDFKLVEGQRPEFRHDAGPTYTKTASPSWAFGSGAHTEPSPHAHREIDPYAPGRAPALNYKLLISAIVPRPIGFLSTRSADGKTTNLAPFSYTQMVNHDPPIFVVGFAGGLDRAKDSLRNLVDTGECTLNVASEHFVEAMNSTAIDAPYGTSEWAISGLTPAPSAKVKPDRVKEAVFSVEGKLVDTREWESKAKPGTKSGTMVIIEGVNFWAREDAVNEDASLLDINVVRPIGRLGGITYSRTTDIFELPRPDFKKTVEENGEGLLAPKGKGQ